MSESIKPSTPTKEDRWKKIASHNDTEIRGFFGQYRFLSNFWPAKVFLDGEEYSCSENAYQAAKYKREYRTYFRTCSPRDAVKFVEENHEGKYSHEEWNSIKLEIMKKLLVQKFDKNLNPDNYKKLVDTGNKYLEEANDWEDTYWGVNKGDKNEPGIGENNLGKLLMEVRDELIKEVGKETG